MPFPIFRGFFSETGADVLGYFGKNTRKESRFRKRNEKNEKIFKNLLTKLKMKCMIFAVRSYQFN